MSVNAMVGGRSAGDAARRLGGATGGADDRVLDAAWPAGVGKSQLVRTLAAEIGAELYDVRLTTVEPQDLRGLPYYDHAAKKTRWYRPEDLPEDEGRPAVLFLDELTAASPTCSPRSTACCRNAGSGGTRCPRACWCSLPATPSRTARLPTRWARRCRTG